MSASPVKPNVSQTVTITDSPTVRMTSFIYVSAQWKASCPITIDHTKCGSSNSTNFPVFFDSSTNGTLQGFLKTVANGGIVVSSSPLDVAFYSDAALTIQLDHEIDTYSASSGTLTAWIRIPRLSSSADTTIYIAFGNVANVDWQNTTGVWDSHFNAVYHFGDGSSVNGNDSTGNAQNLSTSGSGISATTGQIGGGAAFTGAGSLTNSSPSSVPTGTAARTLSVWFKQSDLVNRQALFGWGDEASGSDGTAFQFEYDSPFLSINVGNGGVGFSFTTDNTTWHLAHATTSGGSTDADIKVYIDGVDVTGNPLGTSLATTSKAIAAGQWVNGSGAFAFYYTGNLDEARISDTARSTDWITTEYNNQSSPTTFWDLSAMTVAFSKSVAQVTIASDFSARIRSTSRSSAESFTISETSTRVYSGSRSVSDGFNISDANSRIFSAPRATNEGGITNEAPSRLFGAIRSPNEGGSTFDYVARLAAANRSASEGGINSDFVSRLFSAVRSMADSLPISELSSRVITANRNYDELTFDAGITSEFSARVFTGSRSAADQSGFSDGGSRALTMARTFADGAAGFDNASKFASLTRAAADRSGFSENSARAFSAVRNANDAGPALDYPIRAAIMARSVADTGVASDISDRVFNSIRAAFDTGLASDISDRVQHNHREFFEDAADVVLVADSLSTNIIRWNPQVSTNHAFRLPARPSAFMLNFRMDGFILPNRAAGFTLADRPVRFILSQRVRDFIFRR